jgi:N-acetylglucosaminyl-diphospho-decaprenol L-rhamnosyltransferase
MDAVPDITISIINTNNLAIALQCLEAVFTTTKELSLQVVVVNNACTDDSHAVIAAKYPQVQIIENETMLGFSTNNNLALQEAAGRYWMLLNDDTFVQEGAFQKMVRFMDETPAAGVVGAALLNRDGSPQYCYDYKPSPLYEGLRPFSEMVRPRPASHGQPLEVGYVSGACIMVRASAAQQVGLLDTRFDPLYSEEVDWCYRFIQAGWKVIHLPQAKVIHLGEVSGRRASPIRYERIYQKKTTFFRKHFGEKSAREYKASLFLVNLVKSLYWALMLPFQKDQARQELAVHKNILHQVARF